MEINAEVATVTTKTFTVKLTEAELTAALVDARPLQRELRRARNAQIAPEANLATAGYAGHTARGSAARVKKTAKMAAKMAAKKTDKRKVMGETVECPGCGQPFARQGLGPHKRGCPPYQLKKAAEEARAKAA